MTHAFAVARAMSDSSTQSYGFDLSDAAYCSITRNSTESAWEVVVFDPFGDLEEMLEEYMVSYQRGTGTLAQAIMTLEEKYKGGKQ